MASDEGGVGVQALELVGVQRCQLPELLVPGVAQHLDPFASELGLQAGLQMDWDSQPHAQGGSLIIQIIPLHSVNGGYVVRCLCHVPLPLVNYF